MRIGLGVGEQLGHSRDLPALLDEVAEAAGLGFAQAWIAQTPWHGDALTRLAIVGREVPGIRLGTAVIPTFPRHPAVLAQQVSTVCEAIGPRLEVGLGLSHRVVVQGMLGYPYDRLAVRLEEYLRVLRSLLAGAPVDFAGETVTARVRLDLAGVASCPVLVAALGPRLLEVAGRLADGTVTWMTGPRTLETHIVPGIVASARAADRPPPRVVVGLPVCVTGDPSSARDEASRVLALYDPLPSYRAMLDREGLAGPADLAVIGDEECVAAQLNGYEQAGATELLAVAFGTPEERHRTRRLLSALATQTVEGGVGHASVPRVEGRGPIAFEHSRHRETHLDTHRTPA